MPLNSATVNKPNFVTVPQAISWIAFGNFSFMEDFQSSLNLVAATSDTALFLECYKAMRDRSPFPEKATSDAFFSPENLQKNLASSNKTIDEFIRLYEDELRIIDAVIKAQQQLVQAAYDQKITILGFENGKGDEKTVPAKTWIELLKIDGLKFPFKGEGRTFLEGWRHLRVSREEIEKLWPDTKQEPYWLTGEAIYWIATRDESEVRNMPEERRFQLNHPEIKATIKGINECVGAWLTQAARDGKIRTKARAKVAAPFQDLSASDWASLKLSSPIGVDRAELWDCQTLNAKYIDPQFHRGDVMVLWKVTTRSGLHEVVGSAAGSNGKVVNTSFATKRITDQEIKTEYLKMYPLGEKRGIAEKSLKKQYPQCKITAIREGISSGNQTIGRARHRPAKSKKLSSK